VSLGDELVSLLERAKFAEMEVLPDMRGRPFTFDSPVLRLTATAFAQSIQGCPDSSHPQKCLEK